MMPTPTRSGTDAVASPSSKWLRNSTSGDICTDLHWPMGGPLSTITVSLARNGFRFLSQVAPFGPTELQTYLSEYHRRPRFHVTYTTAAESPRPSAHSFPSRGRTSARHLQRSEAIERRSESGNW